MADLDPILKGLIEANSTAVSVLLSKIASGEPGLSEEIANVQKTDADLKSAICEAPAPAAEVPEPPSAA